MTRLHFDWLRAVLANPGVPPTAKVVYTVLWDRAGSDLLAWPSVGSIARDGGISHRSAHYALRRLEKTGVIESAGKHGNDPRRLVNRYRLLPPPKVFRDATLAPQEAPQGCNPCTTKKGLGVQPVQSRGATVAHKRPIERLNKEAEEAAATNLPESEDSLSEIVHHFETRKADRETYPKPLDATERNSLAGVLADCEGDLKEVRVRVDGWFDTPKQYVRDARHAVGLFALQHSDYASKPTPTVIAEPHWFEKEVTEKFGVAAMDLLSGIDGRIESGELHRSQVMRAIKSSKDPEALLARLNGAKNNVAVG